MNVYFRHTMDRYNRVVFPHYTPMRTRSHENTQPGRQYGRSAGESTNKIFKNPGIFTRKLALLWQHGVDLLAKMGSMVSLQIKMIGELLNFGLKEFTCTT